MPPQVSAILPCYNCAPYLDLSLRSLLQQTHRSLEVVAVDDCSTDGTAQVLAEWQTRLPNLTVLRTPENRGVSAARNLGLTRAEGEFIAFVDPDDWVGPGYLESLLRTVEDTRADFVKCGHTQVVGSKRTVFDVPETRRGVRLDPRTCISPTHRSTLVDFPYSWGALYRRDFLERNAIRFPEHLHTAEDRPYIWFLLTKAESVAVSWDTSYFYRRAISDSLTAIADDRQLHFIEAIRSMLAYLTEIRAPDAWTAKAYRQSFAIIASHEHRRARFNASQRDRMGRACRDLFKTMRPELFSLALQGFGAPRTRSLRRLGLDGPSKPSKLRALVG